MWDRIAGASFTARALYQLGIRPGDTVLNSWLYGTHKGAWCFDEALCMAQLTSAHHEHGHGDLDRATGQAGHRVRRHIDLDDGRLPLAPRRRGARVGLRPCERPEDPGAPQHGDPSADADLRPDTTGPTAFTKCSGSRANVRCTTACTSTIDGFFVQVVDVETGEPKPDGELGSLCVTSSTKRLAASSATTSWTCRIGIRNQLWLRFVAAQDGSVHRSRRQHDQAAGGKVWPEGIGSIAWTCRGRCPTTS